MAVSSTYIACGCTNGIVRLRATRTLNNLGDLKRPSEREHALSALLARGVMPQDPKFYPDAVDCSFDASGERLVVVYDDRQVLFWNLEDLSKITCYRSLRPHSDCIWDIAPLPQDKAKRVDESGSSSATEPSSEACPAFITCSSDGSIRIWKRQRPAPENNGYETDSSESDDCPALQWMGQHGCDWEAESRVINVDLQSNLEFATPPAKQKKGPEAALKPISLGDRSQSEEVSTPVLQCVRASPSGKHIAVGDSKGHLHVYDAENLDQVHSEEAHAGPVLQIAYSTADPSERTFLATGGQDGVVNVYEAHELYQRRHCLDGHGSPISGICFADGGTRLVICAEKTIIFRTMHASSARQPTEYHRQFLPRTTIHSVELNKDRGTAITACQDRLLRVWNLATGQMVHSIATETLPNWHLGHPVQLAHNPVPSTVACCHASGALCLYQYFSGQCLALTRPHTTSINGGLITWDGAHAVTVGGDGCIFIWRLAYSVKAMSQCRQPGAKQPPEPGLTQKILQISRQAGREHETGEDDSDTRRL
eukprot:evm.model.scf_574.6 EVM.evm.TU.scf_574.6   scf_574:35917-40091(+)